MKSLIKTLKNLFPRKVKFHYLIIKVEKLRKNSWIEIEGKFGKYKGITAPGVNMPKSEIIIPYLAKYTKKEKILRIIRKLGYEIKSVKEEYY